MYLPSSKYKVLNARGEIKTLEGTPYFGSYIKTYDGQYFQGDSIDSPGPALLGPPPPPPRPRPDPIPPVQGPGGVFVPQGRLAFQDRYKTVEDLFHTLYIRPTEQDYKNTGYVRYIVQQKSTKQIVETNQSRYEQLVKDGYTGVQVPWKILGPLNTVGFNGKVFKGTTNQNLENLAIVERTIPEIRQYLNDPGQYTRTPAQVAAIEQATGNRVILRVADFVLLKYNTTVDIDTEAINGYVLPGYVIVGYVL